jgi:hypothetical protein
LQSAEAVGKVVAALGIDDAKLRKRVTGLKALFAARNQISHELDLQRPERPGDGARRLRSLPDTKALCQEGFVVAQLLVNAVGILLIP